MARLRTTNRRKLRHTKQGGEVNRRGYFTRANLQRAVRAELYLELDDPEIARWRIFLELGGEAYRLKWSLDENGLAYPITDATAANPRALTAWAIDNFETVKNLNQVGLDHFRGALELPRSTFQPVVSTMFLALDQSTYSGGHPILYETMVFAHKYLDQFQIRYSTRRQAERGHAVIARFARASQPWRIKVGLKT